MPLSLTLTLTLAVINLQGYFNGGFYNSMDDWHNANCLETMSLVLKAVALDKMPFFIAFEAKSFEETPGSQIFKRDIVSSIIPWAFDRSVLYILFVILIA